MSEHGTHYCKKCNVYFEGNYCPNCADHFENPTVCAACGSLLSYQEIRRDDTTLPPLRAEVCTDPKCGKMFAFDDKHTCPVCKTAFYGRRCPSCGKKHEKTVVCLHCGKEFEGRYCPACGVKYDSLLLCNKCGSHRHAESLFCNRCGFAFYDENPKKAIRIKQKNDKRIAAIRRKHQSKQG